MTSLDNLRSERDRLQAYYNTAFIKLQLTQDRTIRSDATRRELLELLECATQLDFLSVVLEARP